MKKLSNNKKRKIRELVEQGIQAMKAGRKDIFERACAGIEKIHPEDADLANLRGIYCCDTNDPAQAEQYFVAAINAAPKRADLHHNLARLYWQQGLYADCLQRCRAEWRLDPRSIQALIGEANCLLKLRRPEMALPILEQAFDRHGKNPELLTSLASAYTELHRHDEARQHLQTLLDLYPQLPDAHFQMGKLKIEQGKLAEGEAEIRATIALQPGHADAHVLLATSFTHILASDTDISALQKLYENSPPDSPECVRLGFAMGKVMEDIGEYNRAFEYFKQANDIRHRHTTYDQNTELEHLENILQTYNEDIFGHCSANGDDSPIFILGMPRCGSTLVEQILASHPDVIARGECEYFEKVLAEENTPDNPLTLERINGFSPEEWDAVGQGYLKLLKENLPAGKRITDKSLTNIRLVGAIHCALPKARIIHVRRNPLDTCLSIYKTNLLGRLHDYGRNLGQLGYYYRMYLQLMQHWRNILPKGAMYELDYETLVNDQETETRKLLEYCGLPWNEACLDFHKADNVVRTASLTQVRRPVYRGSLAAWKRYEKHLQPLIRILGPEYSTEYKPGQL
ncbi:MAG TPA: sulfotransferase [Mariprofundaceae bacterium]|nr:sulfotransferase [Mariprofundaceae bacterium]